MQHITLRPHHFLCAFCFQGKGYSDQFIANFKKLHQELNTNCNVKISATSCVDVICNPCPHRQGEQCKSEEKIQQLDQAHQKIFNWSVTELISWEQAKHRILEHVTTEIHQKICQRCEWLSSGICESVIVKALEKK